MNWGWVKSIVERQKIKPNTGIPPPRTHTRDRNHESVTVVMSAESGHPRHHVERRHSTYLGYGRDNGWMTSGCENAFGWDNGLGFGGCAMNAVACKGGGYDGDSGSREGWPEDPSTGTEAAATALY